MGSKAQRQNKHVKRLEKKIRQWKKKGKKTDGLEKELNYCLGEDRLTHKTGREADSRIKKYGGK
jgi:hypothetical protein